MMRSRGVTLIELLCCLTIVAIGLVMTAHIYPEMAAMHRVHMVRDQLINALHYAQQQALVTHRAMVLLPSESGDWSFGMRLYQKKELLPMHSAQPKHAWHWRLPNTQILWRGFQDTSQITFASDMQQSACNGYFLIKNARHQEKIIINRLGRVRFSHDS